MLHSDAVVEDGQRHFGRFETTPLANPTQQYDGAARAWEWFRTKEWAGFTLSHPELFCSMIIQEAKYLASSELYVFDCASQELVQHSANRMGGSLRLPADLLHSACAFTSPRYRLGYDFGDDEVIVAIDIDATPDAPAVRGRLHLDVRHASHPLVVSSKLPGGSMYTNKIVYPASGRIYCGSRAYTFHPSRDFAILDEHKSHLPYRTRWTWGTFVFPVDGGIAGANFASRESAPGQEEESCLWTPQAAEPLSDIAFERHGDDDRSPWTMRSADGRLDVTFTPQGSKGVDQQLVVAEIHYRQWFGTYEGTLRGQDREWQIHGVHGACEQMDARM